MSSLNNTISFIFTCNYVPMNKIKINRNNKKPCYLEACTQRHVQLLEGDIMMLLFIIDSELLPVLSVVFPPAARDTLAYSGRASASGSYPVTQTIIRL